MKNVTKNICIAAMFAAMIFVSTMILQIPTPTHGYINMGDAFILVGSWLLPPNYAASAAAVGSMLSDIIGGYYHYAAVTFVVKGTMAFVSAFIYKYLTRIFGSCSVGGKIISYVIPAAAAEFVMVAGYTLYELVLYGAGAFAGIISNLEQALLGIVLSVVIIFLIRRIRTNR